MNKNLIVGLGNPGNSYIGTRHNIGFELLDQIANNFSLSFEDFKYGSLAQFKFKGRTIYLLKPSTFMNLSGKAVRYYLQNYKIQKKQHYLILSLYFLILKSLNIHN